MRLYNIQKYDILFNMRISEFERKAILRIINEVIPHSKTIRLFGSRVDDSLKGGDIDLFVDLKGLDPTIEMKIRILSLLQMELGEQKIDLILSTDPENDTRPIVGEALKKGVIL